MRLDLIEKLSAAAAEKTYVEPLVIEVDWKSLVQTILLNERYLYELSFLPALYNKTGWPPGPSKSMPELQNCKQTIFHELIPDQNIQIGGI